MSTGLAANLPRLLLLLTSLSSNLLLAETFSSAPTAPSVSASQVASDFEPYFHQLLQREGIPGGAFVIVSRDRVIKLGTAGFTSVGGHQPILADSVFRLASVSKTFAGELAAMLASEDKLKFTDPVQRLVPQFNVRGMNKPITIGNLLSQSSGIVAHAWDNLIEAGVLIDDILPRFDELRQLCEPGKCYSYQNVAFSLVEQAIVASTKHSYSQQMQQRIFTPLGMRNASVGYQSLLASGNIAQPHIKKRSAWVEGKIEENYYHLAPAAGVNASIVDVALWLQAQLGSRPEIISPDLINTVSAPRVRTPATMHRKYWREHLTDAWYALGWRVYEFNGEPLVGHGGWVSGYRSEIAWSPVHDIGFAVLLNVEDSSASELITTFWDWYFNAQFNASHAQHAALRLSAD